MLEIFKYQLDMQCTIVKIPKNAKILHVAEQHGNVCLWALVNTDNEIERRGFYIAMTGQEIEPTLQYVGTALMQNGNYVVHVFEDVQAVHDDQN